MLGDTSRIKKKENQSIVLWIYSICASTQEVDENRSNDLHSGQYMVFVIEFVSV